MKYLASFIFLALFKPLLFADSIDIVVENYPPYAYKENGNITGLSTDITRYLLEDSGIKAKSWAFAPWKRAFLLASQKPGTLLYTVVRKPNREKLFHWIGPISDRNIYIYKLKRRKDIKASSLEEIKTKGYSIGTVIGTAATEQLKNANLKITETVNYEQNVRMLLLGRTDLIVFLEYSLAYLAKKADSQYSDFEKLFLLDGSKKYYIVIQKDTDSDIVKRLQQSFIKTKHSGKLAEIQKRYLK
ncbi:transporter substrate-binding domain-containing protein [Endozoicomonas sp. SM1973]|uniref:Transporter substrate-binding domain-containing protein n=1 Tax=Spartinivicinus marinus TaxID=2994442 RepID=A0A853I9T4_9GAMM|nr:transporter substrate-binding domain-containing protein [Spartinivicinus marinus]MCX4025303.1 transporter substrate-binding domain-containing protein [Spartinivicinus marinus]NYZ66025.1 transporter substrate-binding domain-containing protein [Spartinivicinus marinus]